MPKSSESSTRVRSSVRTALPPSVTGIPSFKIEEEEGKGEVGTSGTSGTSETLGTLRTSVIAAPSVGRRTPSLLTYPPASQRSMYASLMYDPRKINTTGTHTFLELVTALNEMLRNGESNIEWVPDKEEIRRKSDGSPSKDYLIRSTDYSFEDLLKLRNEIRTWIKTKRRTIYHTIKVLVVDVANSVFAIIEAKGRERPLEILYTMLNRISHEYGCNVIILCIQNHYIGKPKYKDFIRDLQRIFRNNIFIITAHNRASSDDLNGVLTIEILRDLYIDYKFLTGDYLMDYLLEDLPIMFIPEIAENVIDPKVLLGKKTTEQRNTELEKHFRKFEERRERERQERERRTRGGTNKNKYTRKIKNSKKVKTLHKKRNTSKKVLKKYNKNYKKKTLRRKNK